MTLLPFRYHSFFCPLLIIFVIVLLAATPSATDADEAKPAPHQALPQAAMYTVTDLGPLPIVADSIALSLNNYGEVAKWFYAAEGSVYGETWKNNERKSIPNTNQYPTCIPRGINDRGDVVGWASTSRNPFDSQGTTRGFVCSKGHLVLLDTLGGRDSHAFGISKSGVVIGSSELKDGTVHAFKAERNVLADLGTIPGGSFSEARAINSAGEIIGVGGVGETAKHAVAWISGCIIDLGVLPGGRDSSAEAINKHGDIAGFSETPDGYHAFLLSHGKMQDLGTLGYDPSTAHGLNDNDQVVGSSNISPYARHATLWESGAVFDINSLVSSSSGWTLIDAYSINDKGQIVCSGHRPDQPIHAVLLTPIRTKL